MIIRTRRIQSRFSINFVAVVSFSMGLLILGLVLYQTFTFHVDHSVVGSFQNYEKIVESQPTPTNFSRKRKEYLITIDSRSYSILPSVYPYFNEDDFLLNVSMRDRIELCLDQKNNIVGIEVKGIIYLSVSNARKGLILDWFSGIIVAICFCGGAILLFLYANNRKIQKKMDFFSEKIERKWKSWIKKW